MEQMPAAIVSTAGKPGEHRSHTGQIPGSGSLGLSGEQGKPESRENGSSSRVLRGNTDTLPGHEALAQSQPDTLFCMFWCFVVLKRHTQYFWSLL